MRVGIGVADGLGVDVGFGVLVGFGILDVSGGFEFMNKHLFSTRMYPSLHSEQFVLDHFLQFDGHFSIFSISM